MTLPTPDDLYAAEFGDDAADRQRELGRQFWICCGEPRPGPHHVGCSRYDPDEPVAVNPDQESLL